MNIEHLSILDGVYFEESFATILEAYLYINTFHFADGPFIPYSIKDFRYIKKYPSHIFGWVTIKRFMNIMESTHETHMNQKVENLIGYHKENNFLEGIQK